MTQIELLKFDVRVTARMLKRNALTDQELAAHVAGLADAAEKCDSVSAAQPALGSGASVGSQTLADGGTAEDLEAL
ncbi:MAG: hypothetical protein KF718_13845 [Polyangiaceae bacterium]|nr:hypothetical protein [Polyangiaceae bacterium]